MKTTSGTMGTSTGSDNAFTHVLSPDSTTSANKQDTEALVVVGGTFTGATFAIDGLVRGTDATWIPLSIINRKTKVRSSGSEAAADSTVTAWQVDVGGCSKIRVYPSAGTPTAATAVVGSGTQSDFSTGGAIVQVVNSALSTFGAGIAFGGATAANVITIPDNLADALNIKEGANSYIKITTTDGAEAITLGKMPRIPTATVAAAGNAQGNAAALVEGFNQVTGADDTKGVILPSAVAGMVVIVKSTVSNKILKVYPNTSDGINAIIADSPISFASGPTIAAFYAYDATTWYTLPLLPS